MPSVPPVASKIVPVVPGVPDPGSHVTQTELATANFTARTREVVPAPILDQRIGRTTVAGALNDQVRFRVEHVGADPHDWLLHPDSPTAAALVQSKAGARVLAQLTTAVRSTRDLGERSNLRGFILAKDDDSVRAGLVLAELDSNPELRHEVEHARDSSFPKIVDRITKHVTLEDRAGNAAWNAAGWITFFPSVARTMLTAANAYTPSDGDAESMFAPTHARWVAGNATHETQHSITPVTETAYRSANKWMEEGISNVMARTPVFLAQQQRHADMGAADYATRLRAEDDFDPGWKPFTPPALPPAKEAKNEKTRVHNYEDSQVVLRDLVRMAGGDFRSTAGQQKVFHLLQEQSVRFVPGRLADAIIAEHGLDPGVRERLRERIANAVSIDGGADAIAAEFGIT